MISIIISNDTMFITIWRGMQRHGSGGGKASQWRSGGERYRVQLGAFFADHPRSCHEGAKFGQTLSMPDMSYESELSGRGS